MWNLNKISEGDTKREFVSGIHMDVLNTKSYITFSEGDTKEKLCLASIGTS